MHRVHALVLSAAILAVAGAAFAQAAVTVADIARLDATAVEIDRQVAGLGRSDVTLATESARRLADLRDDVAYLRVKLRRDGTVTRAEYTDVHDRLETLRVTVAGRQRVSVSPVLPPEIDASPGVVPVASELDVRLQTALNSGTSRLEQRFEATTVLDWGLDGKVVVPAGSVVRGFVSSVRPAGRIDRTGSLTLSFDEILIGPRVSRLRASVVKALDPKLSDDVTRIGAGAAVGAILGGILGGARGALLGVLIGGGGTIASTEGSDVDLPPGTILRISLDQALDLTR